MKNPQQWTIVMSLALASALLLLRGDTDRVPPSRPLAELPVQIGPWTGTEIPITASVLDVLGKGIFLNRLYQAPSGTVAASDSPPIGLFIGYFPTQRTGQSIHSPQNCLPGSGWTFESSGVTEVAEPAGNTYQVGEYIVSNGVSRQEVLYWYRTHGHNIANDYLAKGRMLVDSILYHRTDAALIRVVTPLQNGETQRQAHQRALKFTEQVSPMLPAFIPN